MALNDFAAAIITKNAGKTLGATLDSLARFPEVVVYDNGSTDDTLEIAGRYENVTLHTGEFMGFGPTNNHAVGLATRDWILSIDADEVVSAELADSIDAADLGDPAHGYRLLRHNYFMGKYVGVGGWQGDWMVRVYNRTRFRYTDDMVHEWVVTPPEGRASRLKGPLRHASVEEIGVFLSKVNHYTELRRQAAGKAYHPAIVMVRAVAAFARSFVLQAGFLAGWRGLIIAVVDAEQCFYKYMKVYADRKRTMSDLAAIARDSR